MQPAPLIIVIFGATGDLSRTKLFSALMDLSANELLPAQTHILGVARKPHTKESFRAFVRENITPRAKAYSSECVETFLSKISYFAGDFSTVACHASLAKHLSALPEVPGERANILFYLSVQPSLYESIFANLALSGLSTPRGGAWVRIAVEKPFGNDTESAALLDAKLGTLFSEEQIFRIDHYLAKEALENIVAFRFGNILFEPLWNNTYIESVYIWLFEKGGIGTRGNFYEAVGALRDVGQNHLLQMLALIAMEDPREQTPHALRGAREAILSSLMPAYLDDIVTGQYASYRGEANVSGRSNVETYFKLPVYLDIPRWHGVPFILESGKRMRENSAGIRITFKEIESSLCTRDDTALFNNELTFLLQPHERISVSFFAKKRGLSMALEKKELSFDYAQGSSRLHDAYEKLLFDCIAGDQTLFTTSREVAASWKFITPILSALADRPPHPYRDGTNGPLDTSQ